MWYRPVYKTGPPDPSIVQKVFKQLYYCYNSRKTLQKEVVSPLVTLVPAGRPPIAQPTGPCPFNQTKVTPYVNRYGGSLQARVLRGAAVVARILELFRGAE